MITIIFPLVDDKINKLSAKANKLNDSGISQFPGAQAFSRKHPLSCWLSTMLVIFAGGMVVNGLLGEPMLAPLKNTPQLVIGTVTW